MRRVLVLVALVAVLAAVAVGGYLFEPWRLFTDSTVDEAAPTSGVVPASQGSPGSTETPATTGSASAGEPSAPARDRVLAEGEFEDAEHATAGVARILELADGRRFVRLEGLATSDGPDLHVWVTDRASGGEWGSYDDGRYVRLGRLKANNGNQNYEIPADADLAGLRSVVIWCDRFNVAFGTAPVRL
jgi:hypothetical protein